MASPVSICSQALILLGAQPINDFGEATDRARIASNLYPDEREQLIRAHTWNCCVKRAVLAPEATAPAFGYARQFLLPGECLRLLSVGADGHAEDYQLEGRHVLYDGTALSVRYLYAPEEALWDKHIVHVMKLRMAWAMAYPITKSSAVRDGAREDYQDALRLAKAIDGQENPPEEILDSPLLTARLGGQLPSDR